MENRTGLTEIQATEILSVVGYNELPSSARKSWLEFLWNAIREPMILLLFACATVYFFVGEIHDAIVLMLSVAVVVGISFYQEIKSGRALEALRDLTSPRALVVRSQQHKRISARDVVPGDLLLVAEGDRIAADCLLVESSNLQTDESLLTGESLSVEKSAADNSNRRLFASTLITRGSGMAVVTHTGSRTEIGKIGDSVIASPEERTRLQNEVAQAVRTFGILGATFSFLIIGVYVFKDGNWPRALLAGLAAAMALLPEEFPVVLTVFLALGAWRLSKKNVLVRQAPATENLGAITALCVDKTGTLTVNQMTVSQLRSSNEQWDLTEDTQSLPEAPLEIVKTAVLASRIDPFDPMEKAIHKILNLGDLDSSDEESTLIREYPLSPQLMAMSQVWQNVAKTHYRVGCKGAPEAVLKLCRLDQDQTKNLLSQVREMSSSGLRVIAVAKAHFTHDPLPSTQEDFDFKFLGLVGLHDPVRAEVPSAIARCHSAGIRVIMMTGDYPGTASEVARIAGLQYPNKILTGAEIEKLNDLELRQQIRNVNVFARMVPIQKLRIVNALKTSGEVVAMTGDGVNDAPSLKWADVGIAMGQRGTDVAREAADIVLLDDCFSSIVTGIRLGRMIFENIQRAIRYIFAVHVPIAGMTVLPMVLGVPPALFPIHIVFLELIIDPACSLIFESTQASAETMTKPPRKIGLNVFNRRDFLRSSLQGFAAFVAVLGVYLISLNFGMTEQTGRTIAFTTFVFSNLGLIVVNQAGFSQTINRPFLYISCIAITTLSAAIYIPFLQKIFGFSPLGPYEWVFAIGAALLAAIAAFIFEHSSKLRILKSPIAFHLLRTIPRRQR